MVEREEPSRTGCKGPTHSTGFPTAAQAASGLGEEITVTKDIPTLTQHWGQPLLFAGHPRSNCTPRLSLVITDVMMPTHTQNEFEVARRRSRFPDITPHISGCRRTNAKVSGHSSAHTYILVS